MNYITGIKHNNAQIESINKKILRVCILNLTDKRSNI
jgi:hypothetical protein